MTPRLKILAGVGAGAATLAIVLIGMWQGTGFQALNPVAIDAVAGSQQAPLSEVDFGMAELDPGGRPVPIASFKRGGPMVLFAGEELYFEALGDAPLPTLVLHAGATVQVLSGTSGRVTIAGPARQALPGALLAQGTRVSLPGGSPARVSVKVQVYGVARQAS